MRVATNLTPARGMAILECVLQRGLISLAIVIGVCLAGVVFLPAGAGPYTAVYGPASALRAQRAILLLALTICFLASLSALLVVFVSIVFPFRARKSLISPLSPGSAFSSTLRC